MDMLGNAIYRFISGVILCSIILSLFPEGRMKELLHTFLGVFLTAMLLQILAGVELPDLNGIEENYLQQAQTAASTGEEYARQQYMEFIKQRLEAYILDIAKRYGCTLTVHVEVDGDGYPVSAALWGTVSSRQRRELEEAIAEEVGIAKEDQQWNGLQTRKDSAPP